MSGRDLLTDERRLFENLCAREYLAAGFQRVSKNQGAPGIDGVTMAEFETRLDEELSRLTVELESWTYETSPVRRVEIPKPGGQGIRVLGVPTVRDRVVQATEETASGADLRAVDFREQLRLPPWAEPRPSQGSPLSPLLGNPQPLQREIFAGLRAQRSLGIAKAIFYPPHRHDAGLVQQTVQIVARYARTIKPYSLASDFLATFNFAFIGIVFSLTAFADDPNFMRSF